MHNSGNRRLQRQQPLDSLLRIAQSNDRNRMERHPGCRVQSWFEYRWIAFAAPMFT
jgi:hypothetical protein